MLDALEAAIDALRARQGRADAPEIRAAAPQRTHPFSRIDDL
jgi:hypothetical protein